MADSMDHGDNFTDPFDNFEFKPLTDGLGFHKKAEKIKNEVKNAKLSYEANTRNLAPPPTYSTNTNTTVAGTSAPAARYEITDTSSTNLSARGSEPRPATQSISDLIASLPPSLDFVDDQKKESGDYTRPQIFQPIAREEYKTNSAASPRINPTQIGQKAGPTIGSVMPAPGTRAGGLGSLSGAGTAQAQPLHASAAVGTPPSPYRDRMNESFAKAFPQAERTKREPTLPVEAEKLHAAIHNIPGAILDAMVVLGVSTIFLICILAITRVNLLGLLNNAQTDFATQVHLVMLFVAVLQMYMLTARSFFGASLGEWAFDLQLGTDEQQRQAIYPLQVAWRTLFISLTGFIFVPLLSILLRRDIAKSATGLELLPRG